MRGVKEISACDVCGNRNLESVLDLGIHPLCDDLVPIGSPRICREYPIEVLFCEVCKTAHQRFQVEKELLFPLDYHYRARFTKDVTNGMEQLAEIAERRLGPLKGKIVLDVGCNDGCLLDCFKARGAKTFGVEPTGAADDAEAKGHAIFRGYFDENLVLDFVPDIITFTNVFAHLENLRSSLKALISLIGRRTTVIIENHYLKSILESGQFDTFYHEHPRTYSATSFRFIARQLGLDISNLEFPQRYGGNIRVFLAAYSSHEGPIEHIGKYDFRKLADRLEEWKENTRAEVMKRAPIAAVAFPGRASILIRLLGLDERHIPAVYQIHGSPKIGHYVPGTRIPILDDGELPKSDAVLNLAWHISGEVKQHLAELGHYPEIIDVCSKSSATASVAMATS